MKRIFYISSLSLFAMQSAIAMTLQIPHLPSAVLVTAGERLSDDGDYPDRYPLLAVSNDGRGELWAINPLPDFTRGNFESASCTGSGSTAVCAAVGGDGIPLMAISFDGGNKWTKKEFDSLSLCGDHGRLEGVSCTGNGSTAICAAAGYGKDSGHPIPLLTVSVDGGHTWTDKVIPKVIHGGYGAVSCSGNGATAICTAVGEQKRKEKENVLLVVSTDGGQTWAQKPIDNFPTDVQYPWLESVSCTGSDSNTTVCAAVGNYNDINGWRYFLVTSTNGGKTWATKSVANYSERNELDTVSCTGSGLTAVCVAGGYYGLAVSTDGGNTWAAKSTANLEATAFITSSCTGSGSAAICAAGGYGGLAVSTDGGNTWTPKSIGRDPIRAVNCTGSGPTAICTAAGDGYIAASTDGGNNWALKSISGLLPYSSFGTSGGNKSLRKMHH